MVTRLIQSYRKWKTFYKMCKELYDVMKDRENNYWFNLKFTPLTTIHKPKEFIGLCNDRLVTGCEQESENSWWAFYHGRKGEKITIGYFPTEQEAHDATRALFTHVDECLKTFKSIVDANAGGK